MFLMSGCKTCHFLHAQNSIFKMPGEKVISAKIVRFMSHFLVFWLKIQRFMSLLRPNSSFSTQIQRIINESPSLDKTIDLIYRD